ncbi:MAG: hypothetical protein QXG39_01815 [Candidatus Aenigmatarchaeota archaeon]
MKNLRKSCSILTHPLQTLFLFLYAREEATKILKNYPEEYFQFYRSNRLRGYGIKEAVERAVAGYGCYKGFKAEPIREVGILNKLI